MLPLSLGLPLAVISLVGFLVNAYIVLVVVLTKQVSANNILLLHLGIVNALLCTAFLVFSVPNIARSDGSSAFGAAALCTFHGVLVTTMHPVALWTLCCLNCDRCCAIAAPLHYGDFVNTRRVMICLAAGWTFALLLSIPPILHVAPYRYNADFGACLPYFGATTTSTTDSTTTPLSSNYNHTSTTTPTDSTTSTLSGAVLWYAIVYTLSTLVLPAALIIGCNIKVLMIARYHNHRIASAIYEVTLSAQVTITHQRNPFDADGRLLPATGPPMKPLRPPRSRRSPVISVLQLIGTFVLMYAPYYTTVLWNSIASALGHWGGNPDHRHMLTITAASLLACSPFVNGILYGVKNKIMRKTFQNYWRKQKTKSEICQEIQARTPSTCGSRRPSLSTLSVLQQRPPLSQRRMSETGYDHQHHNLHLHLRHHHLPSSTSQHHRYPSSDPDRPLMKRIASEISWRPTSLTFADMTDTSPTTLLSPVAVAAAAAGGIASDSAEFTGSGIMVHTTSSNTLQLPAQKSPIASNGNGDGSDSTNESSHGSAILMHSNGSTTGTTGRSALGLLQKMLRIEIRDETQHHDEPKPLRSPRILITQATYVDDSDLGESFASSHEDDEDVVKTCDNVERSLNKEGMALTKQTTTTSASVGSYSWPMARRKQRDTISHKLGLNDDADDGDDVEDIALAECVHVDEDGDDDDEEDAEVYSRLLVAATSSLSASNSTTMSTVSMRPMLTTPVLPIVTSSPSKMLEKQRWTTSCDGDKNTGDVGVDGKPGHCVIQFKEHLFASQKDIVL